MHMVNQLFHHNFKGEKMLYEDFIHRQIDEYSDKIDLLRSKVEEKTDLQAKYMLLMEIKNSEIHIRNLEKCLNQIQMLYIS